MDWRSGLGPAAFGACMVFSPVVMAYAPPTVNARVEISAAVAGSSATLEAIERQANARDRIRQQEIAALQARLAEAEARGAAEDARLQAQLIEAREALVADLASRDRAYAEEIAVFRREVTSIASTADGAAALARFNAGDRAGAIAVLDQLRRARDAARQARADIESAAEARQIATLARDARGKSDPAFDTAAVITRYEEVVQLDPGEYGDWDQLVRLYITAGRRNEAIAATARLEELATSDVRRSIALSFRADLLLSQGERDVALGLYRRGLEIDERLSAADPGSVALAGNVTASRERIGDVLLSQGDLEGALGLYRRSLETDVRLLAANPTSAFLARAVTASLERIGGVLLTQADLEGAVRMLSISLQMWELQHVADPADAEVARGMTVPMERIGDVRLSQGDSDGALELFRRSLEIRERLSAADPASADLSRGVRVALTKIGDVLVSQGDQDGALALYRRSLEIAERLSVADPASAPLARDVSLSLNKVGDVLSSQGDRDGALVLYRRSLEIAERLSAADPASETLARHVFVTCWNMAVLTGERRYWERGLAVLRDLEAKGMLAEADKPYIAQLETSLARLGLPAT